MERVRVAIVINDFLVGGAQRLVAELVSRLDQDRFDVSLITLFRFEGRDTMHHLLPPGARVHALDFSGFADARSWLRLWRVLREERPDVVLSHLFFSNTVTRTLGLLAGYRSIIVEHNTYEGKTRLQILCDRILSRLTFRIVAVSSAVLSFTAAQERIPKEKFELIRNGIDVESVSRAATASDAAAIRAELSLPEGRRLIISVGRMTGQKNLELMVDGFCRFAAENAGYDLVLLGDGKLRERIEHRISSCDAAQRMHLLGNRPSVAPYLAASDFLVSTSRIEGLSMAHLEALACSTPLLATRTAGSEEIIEPGVNGYFIDDASPEGVCAALERMAASDPVSLRDGARRTAGAYDIRDTVRRYESLIASAASRTRVS